MCLNSAELFFLFLFVCFLFFFPQVTANCEGCFHFYFLFYIILFLLGCLWDAAGKNLGRCCTLKG